MLTVYLSELSYGRVLGRGGVLYGQVVDGGQRRPADPAHPVTSSPHGSVNGAVSSAALWEEKQRSRNALKCSYDNSSVTY